MATALTAILASAALIGACSSDDKASGNGSAFNGSDGKGSGSAATSTTVAPQPTSVFDLARSTTCTADRQTLELAVEAFRELAVGEGLVQ
ncbi:MAG TPA: hypothetical protein PLV68_04855, partial [Ilumatobacteraceae bacterium]|nr:hypothetical protein [Ilumatobacteraceae bacterium]